MTREEILKNIEEKFPRDITGTLKTAPNRAYFDIKPEAIMRMSKYIFRDLGARFNIASGVDARQHIEILYHFTVDEADLTVSLRVKLSKEKPVIESIAPLFEGANWIEREIHEMFGIEFKGHPDMRKLLLPDNWPDGVYPLRADYKEWDDSAIRDRGV